MALWQAYERKVDEMRKRLEEATKEEENSLQQAKDYTRGEWAHWDGEPIDVQETEGE